MFYCKIRILLSLFESSLNVGHFVSSLREKEKKDRTNGKEEREIEKGKVRSFFQSKHIDIFLISPRKHMLQCGTHQKHLTEVLLMSTHNICFHREIRNILT